MFASYNEQSAQVPERQVVSLTLRRWGRQRFRHKPERYVKLMAEYSCHMPLWGTVDWQKDCSLSRDLLDRLVNWQRSFDTSFHWDHGWRDTAERDAWAREADELSAALRRELPSDIPLVVDMWPIEPSIPWWKPWVRRGPFVYQ